MNFEIVDNIFQITVLWAAALTATGLSIRYRERRFLILALAYACFSMGTLYWVLYLAILGMFPQVFYVAEISWLPTSFTCPCRSSGPGSCASVFPYCRRLPAS